MNSPVRLSRNELSSLLKYAFQGLFGHTQDCGALADSVLLLEMHGHDGLALMIEALKAGTLRAFNGKVGRNGDGLSVDLGGGSVLMGLPHITDFVVVGAQREGVGNARIVNSTQTSALVGVVLTLRRAGFLAKCDVEQGTVSCRWDEAKDEKRPNEHYRTCLKNGIEVQSDILAVLTEIADRTLVETSDASRRGAGD